MQPYPEKSYQQNNYGSTEIHPPYQGPPPSYSPYPQQPAGYAVQGTPYVGSVPLYQQCNVVTTNVYQPLWSNRLVIPITINTRLFLLISGFIYTLWGFVALSVQVAVAVNSYSTYYSGFWTGSYIVVSGIMMMIIGCRTSYSLYRLIRVFILGLICCVLGLIVSIVNYNSANDCSSLYPYYCDETLGDHFRMALLITFALGTIHTIINLTFVARTQRRASANPHQSVPCY